MDTPKPAAPRREPTDDAASRPPSAAMLKAYHDVLTLTQTLGREPTPAEAFPLVQHLTGALRGRTGVGCTRAVAADRTLARNHHVTRVVRWLADRCGKYYADAQRTEGLKAQIGDLAIRTARDLLTPQGPYDHDPKLHRSKVQATVDLLRIVGLSSERGAGREEPANTSLGAHLSQAEQELLDTAKRLDYERQMRERMGAGAAAAVNRLGTPSVN